MGLLSLTVQENTDGLYRCEVTFTNWGAETNGDRYVLFDKAVLDFGQTLSIDMGDGDAQSTVFTGRITAMEGRYPQQSPPELLLLAEDRLQDLRMVRRTRSFENKDLKVLFRQISSEHGLQLDMDFQGPNFGILTQVNQTDLAFMRDCLRRVDAELWMEDRNLFVRKRSAREGEEITFVYGYRLLEFSVTADLAGQRSSVVVSGWDVASKESMMHEAAGNTIQNELGSDTGGGQILSDKFGSRVQRIVHEVPLSNSETLELAESEYRRMSRKFVVGHGQADGDGRIRVGRKIRLEGLGKYFNGSYYVSEVSHSFDTRHGYRTYFQVEKPGIGDY